MTRESLPRPSSHSGLRAIGSLRKVSSQHFSAAKRLTGDNLRPKLTVSNILTRTAARTSAMHYVNATRERPECEPQRINGRLTSSAGGEDRCVDRDVALQHAREVTLLFCSGRAEVLVRCGRFVSRSASEPHGSRRPTKVRVTSVVPSKYWAARRVRRRVLTHLACEWTRTA